MNTTKIEISNLKQEFGKLKSLVAAEETARRNLDDMLKKAERLATTDREKAYEKAIAEVKEAEAWHKERADASNALKKKINDAINLLDDEEAKNLVFLKFMRFKTLEEIGFLAYMAPATVKRRLDDALTKIIKKQQKK